MAVNKNYDERVYIFTITILLILIGTLYIYNVGSIQAQRWHKPDYYYFLKQFYAILIGMVLLILAYNIPVNFYRKIVPALYFITLFLLMSVFFFSAVNGSHRWIKLPFINFQPSEFAKFVSIVYLAHYLDKKSEKISDFFKGFLPAMILLGLLSALILIEPDYGTSFLIMCISIILMFVGGASIKHILGIIAFSIPPAVVLLLSGYHRERLLSFLDPWSYYHGAGYQLIQSLIAIGSGGFFGKGFGNSIQKLYFLPEAHTDFIFSIISEEFGFLGSLIVVTIILLLFLEIKRVALNESDKFKRLLCFGIGLVFVVQTIIHLFVTTGLFPTKGIALPFISYGGSSVMISLFMIGVVLRCKREQL